LEGLLGYFFIDNYSSSTSYLQHLTHKKKVSMNFVFSTFSIAACLPPFYFILTITLSLATVVGRIKINNDKKKHANCWQFSSPCRCGGTMQGALPNGAYPGLHSIGRLPAPYCPSGGGG
jgi:hypothetical protein